MKEKIGQWLWYSQLIDQENKRYVDVSRVWSERVEVFIPAVRMDGYIFAGLTGPKCERQPRPFGALNDCGLAPANLEHLARRLLNWNSCVRPEPTPPRPSRLRWQGCERQQSRSYAKF